MRKIFLFGLVLSAVSMAKITTYTNEEVMSKVLTSKELNSFKSTEKDLKGLALSLALIENTGGNGIGGTYNVDLIYTEDGKKDPEEGCHFKATITNEKVAGPSGIAGSSLGKVTFSKVTCGTSN